jgi:hypothetical protein
MTEQYLIILGSSVFLVLGTMQLLFTFFTDKFLTRNPETAEMMKADHPVLTRRTTMWKAWIGFNASHSSGVMFIGGVNILLATQYFDLYQKSFAFLLLSDITVLFYLFLAIKYWFRIPLAGVVITSICFILSTLIILWGR